MPGGSGTSLRSALGSYSIMAWKGANISADLIKTFDKAICFPQSLSNQSTLIRVNRIWRKDLQFPETAVINPVVN